MAEQAGLGSVPQPGNQAGLGDKPMTQGERFRMSREMLGQGYSAEDIRTALGMENAPAPPPPTDAERKVMKRDLITQKSNLLRSALEARGLIGTSREQQAADAFREQWGEHPDWYRPDGVMKSLFGNKGFGD
jgi:hypothetical protein